MGLKEELGFKNPIRLGQHEAILNVYYTGTGFKKRVTEFLKQYGLTDVQFNVLLLLGTQSNDDGGLNQAQLSDMMLVNRANITSLIDRMEKTNLVKRTAADDRRYNIIKLTAKGKGLLEKVDPLYAKEIKRVMSPLSEPEQKKLIAMLEKIRQQINR